ncbi:hypothetical protein L202_03036 [Cryptococcus amylolentus CBS 6039]|uniref:RRM domain-containing protein n=1 Tax=Cryptococcus amylolentus CBS 6039 TaxID=1295533 RepID=A0A1E3HZA9_9TREE|nr:hypothetical protein L202_03036 [Cryptococcus amylolentus CBS 6039]ODN80911.1 hypothetical protein L202_03036 [Cryptococcus amylolentus CBS 6039]
MDAGYDALEQAASSYSKNRDRDDDSRSHRSSHRERDYDRDADRHSHRERNDRHRERSERDYHRSDRDRGDRDRGGDRRERDRDGRGYRDDRGSGRDGRDRYPPPGYDDRPPRRRRREEDDVGIAAEPMTTHRDRRPRYDEDPAASAAPMRSWSPPRDFRRGGGGGGRRDDDWRGGRGNDRRGGGGGGRFYEERRSPTPQGTLSLEERKEKLSRSLWDTAPEQFANVSAIEAKATGLFTYGPGRVPPPAHLGIPATFVAGSFPPSNPIRTNKRLYVGGINGEMTEKQIQDHYNKLCVEKKLVGEGEEAVIECQINNDKNFAFLEFSKPELVDSALEFDGVELDGHALSLKRPKDYAGIDPLLQTFNGVVNPSVADSPNKLFVGGIPTYLTDDQVMELLKSFGELRSFNLVKEGAGVSKGFAFAEYLDPEVTDMAIQGLHNFALGDRHLVVQRAAVGRTNGVNMPIPGSASFLSQIPQFLQNSADAPPSRVMLLLNMVTPEELYSDEEYADILEDINDECSKYGEIEGVRIPRPVPKSKKWESTQDAQATADRAKQTDDEAGVGRVYVLYKDVEGAQKAMKALGGRQFAGRTILVASVSEEEFLGPAPPPPPPEDGAPAPAPDAPPPPPPPADLDAAADAALRDIMGGM